MTFSRKTKILSLGIVLMASSFGLSMLIAAIQAV